MEPFPSFFLKRNEIREKRGYLDEVAKAKKGAGIA
jgi:hypothetical protein